MKIRRSTIALVAAVALAAIPLAPAQAAVGTESGDAGDLPASAQDMRNITPTSITGSIAAIGDEDMYKICLAAGTSFSASTVGGSAVDTQLFLFDAAGVGVVANDDAAGSGTLQSRLPAGSVSTGGGLYHLAISSFNNDPLDSGGNLIFPSSPFTGVFGPIDGDRIASWSNASGATGAYTITLAGTTANCDEPAECKAGGPVPNGYNLIVGTPGNDTLKGTSGKDLIRGLGGNDTIYGYSDTDILCGNDGNDTLDGGSGHDFVYGGRGTDTLNGNSGIDTGGDADADTTFISIEIFA